MTARTIYRELTAAGFLLASYPIDRLTQRPRRDHDGVSGEPIVMAHGFGGDRSNLLGLAVYLEMAGFCNLVQFEYPRWQPISDSVEKLAELVERVALDVGGVHLIGHSLGGLISRHYARRVPRSFVRSLITLGSPYLYDQVSPAEVAIFGDEDPLVPPPITNRLGGSAFGRVIVLPGTGHLGVVYHRRALELIESELRANSRISPHAQPVN